MRPAATASKRAASGVLCLAGPTASGKTALALEMARHWPLEIISVDSALVYRGMDIGTAKPSVQERAQVPHHLIDICDPAQAYSAAAFARDAHALIAQIHARGRHALLVGGTMLYFKALLEGIDDMPSADARLRARIEQQAREMGWPAMHAQLARVDPPTAARLAPNDAQRIQRALEVWHASGRPISAWQRRAAHGAAGAGDPAGANANPTPLLMLSLEPANRTWLHERIAQRIDQMFAAGLVDEVQSLRSRGDLHAGLASMRCVGYRQVLEWLQAIEAGQRIAFGECRDRCIFATRQLAKRQITWLRSMSHRTVVACDAQDAVAQGLAHVTTVWGPPA